MCCHGQIALKSIPQFLPHYYFLENVGNWCYGKVIKKLGSSENGNEEYNVFADDGEMENI